MASSCVFANDAPVWSIEYNTELTFALEKTSDDSKETPHHPADIAPRSHGTTRISQQRPVEACRRIYHEQLDTKQMEFHAGTCQTISCSHCPDELSMPEPILHTPCCVNVGLLFYFAGGGHIVIGSKDVQLSGQLHSRDPIT